MYLSQEPSPEDVLPEQTTVGPPVSSSCARTASPWITLTDFVTVTLLGPDKHLKGWMFSFKANPHHWDEA